MKKILVSFLGVLLFKTLAFAAIELPQISEEEMMVRLRMLDEIPNSIVSLKIQQVDEGMTCDEFLMDIVFKDPTSGANKPIKIQVIKPNIKTPAPALIVIPTSEGVTQLEYKISNTFCKLGVASFITNVNDTRQPATYPSWGTEDQNNRFAVNSIKSLITWIQAQPEFNPDKLAVWGMSLGGITTEMLAGVEPRFKAYVSAASAGHQAAILTESAQDFVVKLKQGRMRAEGIKSNDQYQQMLHKTILFDPWYFQPMIDPSKMFKMMIKGDDRVPGRLQLQSWEIYGKPKYQLINGSGHASNIIQWVLFGGMDPAVNFVIGRLKN